LINPYLGQPHIKKGGKQNSRANNLILNEELENKLIFKKRSRKKTNSIRVNSMNPLLGITHKNKRGTNNKV
jgi:hypothetical protein